PICGAGLSSPPFTRCSPIVAPCPSVAGAGTSLVPSGGCAVDHQRIEAISSRDDGRARCPHPLGSGRGVSGGVVDEEPVMANLKGSEKAKLETYSEMKTGKVCDFCNQTFEEFV